MLDRLDAAAVHRWCALALAGLREHQHEIDELNVYPVPDGDTGTNLVLTLGAAADAVAGATDPGVGAALHRLARGALLGARGNSGVIVAQVFAGLADALDARSVADGPALAGALAEAARAAYRAVDKPVEGTVLSVARAAASGAAGGRGLADVVTAAATAAREALALTPAQLPALARAGVVDAGGRGLVVLLDALVETVTGQAPAPLPASGSRRVPLSVARETGSDEYAYEVQFLLDAPDAALGGLKATLAELGDSLVVVGNGGTWNVHVHVNDVGAAIEAGVAAGRPHRIAVTRFADQVAAQAPAPAAAVGDRGVVAIADGDGIAELFATEGATVVRRGAGAPSTAEILDAIRGCGATRVVVLPNDRNVIAAANLAATEARAEGIGAGVVPTRSAVHALAALAVRDAGRRFEDDVIAMAEAVGACRYAEVTTASREALTVAGRCRPGDVLALVEGEVNLIGRELLPTCRQLLDRLLAAGGELVTLVVGAGAPDGLADDLGAHVAQRWPFVEVQAYRGGQPHYPLLVGVE